MARKRSSWGCVQRVSADTYRIRYWADLGDGYSRRSMTFHGTRREADRRLAELRAEHEVEPGAPRRRASSMTVGDVWARWHEPECLDRLASGDLSASTWRNAKASWRRDIAPRWAGVRCDAVAPLDVQDWLMAMTSSNARIAKIVLGQVLAKAVMYGVCASNAAALRYRMPTRSCGHDAGVYALDEMRDVVGAVRGSPIEPAVILAGLGSCRLGESLGVRCDEVGLVDAGGVAVAVVPISRQVDRVGNVVDRLKNRQSRRTVVVPGPPAVRLASIASELSSGGLEWLCDDGTGRPHGQQRAKRMWNSLLSSAGVPRHPMSNLRNSWETNTHWTLRVDTTLIEKMMGHAGRDVTSRHYDRPDVEMFVEAVSEAYRRVPFADTWDI